MEKSWWQLAYGVLIGLLAASGLWLVTSPPRGEVIQLAPPPSPQPVYVHVTGAVARPGLYLLPDNCRVQDAVGAAGGLLPGADDQSLNLAAFLQDGQKLQIPYQSPPYPVEATRLPSQLPAATPIHNPQPVIPADKLININTATLEELVALPSIGPDKAGRIIAYRTAEGPFESIEAIQEVTGIGPATFERLKDLITVDD